MVFQIFLGLCGASYTFSGPVHISGSVNGLSQKTTIHISGRSHHEVNAPTTKVHVSGKSKVLTIQKFKSMQSKVQNKHTNMGITLGSSEKHNVTPSINKIIGKTNTNLSNINIVKQANLKDRIKARKACWKRCENNWIISSQEQCLNLSGLLLKHCKKELFNQRLACVSQNCKEVVQ